MYLLVAVETRFLIAQLQGITGSLCQLFYAYRIQFLLKKPLVTALVVLVSSVGGSKLVKPGVAPGPYFLAQYLPSFWASPSVGVGGLLHFAGADFYLRSRDQVPHGFQFAGDAAIRISLPCFRLHDRRSNLGNPNMVSGKSRSQLHWSFS
jgi:hypothetical protein